MTIVGRTVSCVLVLILVGGYSVPVAGVQVGPPVTGPCSSDDAEDAPGRPPATQPAAPTTSDDDPETIAHEQRAEPGFAFVEHAVPEGVDVPDGMVWVPGGTTRIGCTVGEPWEAPTFDAEVEPFLLDEHPVTVTQFRAFVSETGYVTQAERFGNSAVFDLATGRWELRDGADWRHPFGPGFPPAEDDHPVTQVSWNDAVAYAEWAGKRLPTEVEWEHAARNGQNGGPRYAWGDRLVAEDGTYRANGWQGAFPLRNTGADGWATTSPVGTTGRSPLGLTDMGGNVWEWCADWFRYYDERGTPYEPAAESQKVHRGGSFLCDPKVCHGFRVSARASSTPETSLCHVGFRCAMDVATADTE